MLELEGVCFDFRRAKRDLGRDAGHRSGIRSRAGHIYFTVVKNRYVQNCDLTTPLDASH